MSGAPVNFSCGGTNEDCSRCGGTGSYSPCFRSPPLPHANAAKTPPASREEIALQRLSAEIFRQKQKAQEEAKRSELLDREAREKASRQWIEERLKRLAEEPARAAARAAAEAQKKALALKRELARAAYIAKRSIPPK